MRAGAALSRLKSDHHVDEAFGGKIKKKQIEILLNFDVPAGRRRRNSSMSSLPKTANKRVSNASSTPVITCEGKEIFGTLLEIQLYL